GVRASRPLRSSEMQENVKVNPENSGAGSVETAESPAFLRREGGMLRLAAHGERTLRYGENSHQSASLYRFGEGAGLAGATQHGGKEMSYNNYVDAEAAVRAVF